MTGYSGPTFFSCGETSVRSTEPTEESFVTLDDTPRELMSVDPALESDTMRAVGMAGLIAQV